MQVDEMFNSAVGGRFKEAYMHLRGKAIVHTQRDFAKLIGSNDGNISRIFRGDTKYTTPSVIARINEASGITFSENYLLRGEGELIAEDATQSAEAPASPSDKATAQPIPPLELAYLELRRRGIVHTQTEVADRVGYNKSAVSQAIKGIPSYVTENFVSAFNKAFGGIFNEDYLLRGEGTLLASDKAPAPATPQAPLWRHLASVVDGSQKEIASRIAQLVNVSVTPAKGREIRFSQKTGLPPHIIGTWIKRGANIGALKKLKDAYPEVSLRWLATGEGAMFDHDPEEYAQPVSSPSSALSAHDPTTPPTNAQEKPYRASVEVMGLPRGSRIIKKLPIFPIAAQAGTGKGYLYDKPESQDPDEVFDEFDAMEVILEGENSDKLKLFRVHGDSMTDGSRRSICQGDVLLCREVYPENWDEGLTNNRFPNVVIAIEEEGILIKRLLKHQTKERKLLLHSLNPAYEDFTVDLEKVRAFFYVEKLMERSMSEW